MTPIERFEEKFTPDSQSGCWIWTASRQSAGYGQAVVKRNPMGAHRVSWMLYRGRIPDGLHVLHHCDVRLCVNPEHLFLGTAADNLADMCRKGRHGTDYNNGELNRAAKLDAKTVAEIRDLYARGGIYQYEIGERYGITQGAVSAIIRRAAWSHV